MEGEALSPTTKESRNGAFCDVMVDEYGGRGIEPDDCEMGD